MVWYKPGEDFDIISNTSAARFDNTCTISDPKKLLQLHAHRVLDVHHLPVHPDNVTSVRCCVYYTDEIPSALPEATISRVRASVSQVRPRTTQAMKNDRTARSNAQYKHNRMVTRGSFGRCVLVQGRETCYDS